MQGVNVKDVGREAEIISRTSRLIAERGLLIKDVNDNKDIKITEFVRYMVGRELDLQIKIGEMDQKLKEQEPFVATGYKIENRMNHGIREYMECLNQLESPVGNMERLQTIMFMLLKALTLAVTQKSDIELLSGEQSMDLRQLNNTIQKRINKETITDTEIQDVELIINTLQSIIAERIKNKGEENVKENVNSDGVEHKRLPGRPPKPR